MIAVLELFYSIIGIIWALVLLGCHLEIVIGGYQPYQPCKNFIKTSDDLSNWLKGLRFILYFAVSPLFLIWFAIYFPVCLVGKIFGNLFEFK